MEETVCTTCGKEIIVGDWPWCPHGSGHANVITDDIPGGIEIRHGLCDPDGTPHKYYSKSEMAKEAKKRGLVNLVTHVVDPQSGSDKSKHTVRWV